MVYFRIFADVQTVKSGRMASISNVFKFFDACKYDKRKASFLEF